MNVTTSLYIDQHSGNTREGEFTVGPVLAVFGAIVLAMICFASIMTTVNDGLCKNVCAKKTRNTEPEAPPARARVSITD